MTAKRQRGAATSDIELRSWPHKKLVNEIYKQVRSDVGGRDMRHAFKKRAIDSGIPEEFASISAYLQEESAKKATKGSRKRIKSKLVEINRRNAVLINGES